MTNINKKVLLLSENKELFNTLKRALRYIASFEFLLLANSEYVDNHDVFLIDAGDGQNNLNKIVGLRLKMHLSPIIVIGTRINQEYYSDSRIWY